MAAPVYNLVVVSLVVMGLAHTLSRERMFAPLRDRFGGKETWLGYLLSCPYCASHWIAFVLVPLTGTYGVVVPYRWGVVATILTWFLSSILVTVIASFFRIAFYFIDESQGLVRRQQKATEQKLRQGERTNGPVT